MTVTVDYVPREVSPGTTLGELLKQFTPFGDEAIIAKRNGAVISEEDFSLPAEDGDVIHIYPLIIGG